MRCPGVGDRRERKGEETVSMVCDAVGDFASAAGDRHTPGGSDDPGLGPAGKTQERYRSCGGDAGSEKEAVRRLPKEDSMRTDVGGNDGPTAATKQWKSGKPKSRLSTFPLLCFPYLFSNQKGGLAADRFAPASRLILG